MKESGDPGYNVWGGKHNVFGRSTKKPKNNGPTRDDEAWSKGAKIVICVIVGIVLANVGLSGITDTISNIVDVFKPKTEVVNNITSSDSSKTNYSKVDIDIDVGDLKDIVEKLLEDEDVANNESLSNISFSNTVLVDYAVFDSDKSFKNNIGKSLKNYSNAVTFLATNSCEDMSNETFNNELKRVGEIISNAEIKSIFEKFDLSFVPNKPTENLYTLVLTFK